MSDDQRRQDIPGQDIRGSVAVLFPSVACCPNKTAITIDLGQAQNQRAPKAGGRVLFPPSALGTTALTEASAARFQAEAAGKDARHLKS
jgi:hypothetical protein